MTEAPLAVASAVIVPEDSTERPPTPPASLKRRQSSISGDTFAKRPRLSHDASTSNGNGRRDSAASPPETLIDDRQAERRRSGQMEERKRGQRLFGALLGTLSQSSSSTAQKRRTDIEKKQQAKLKMQDEERDEKKKLKREALDAVRRGEQKKYDGQSMQIRHSNMLAEAHFLHTKAKPRLYYKPWELLPSEEDQIKDQIKEAKVIIEKEKEQWDVENPVTDQEPTLNGKKEPPETRDTSGVEDTVGSAANEEKPPSPKASEDTNMNGAAPSVAERKTPEPPEASKDQGDDGGEVVEGEEDTVIY